MSFVESIIGKPHDHYRLEIDGLRAIAVVAVVLFHFGYLFNGYLGVDIFFVISGFLITSIIQKEIRQKRFTITNFYIRRLRRIIPLVLFITLIALVFGFFVMLPDDLENLGQSVIATNFFSNNILQFVTTADYWDVINDYKPLLHTWSLGIEEQYYIFFPLLMILLSKFNVRVLFGCLLLLVVASAVLNFMPYSDASKFYLLPFRFYQLGIGGLLAIAANSSRGSHLGDWKGNSIIKTASLFILIAILFVPLEGLAEPIKQVLITVATGVFLFYQKENIISSAILKNKLAIAIGRTSFSIYMWHQLILAFTKYCWIKEPTPLDHTLLSLLILVLSIISFKMIEEPFRDKKRMTNKTVYISTFLLFLITTGMSALIYMRAGVLRDIPELGITKENVSRNMHAVYNDRVYKMKQAFDLSDNRMEVLVVGNSFARDWANVLLESKYKDSIEVRYIYKLKDKNKEKDQVFLNQAKVVFFSNQKIENVFSTASMEGIEKSKIWCVGTKNFGKNNGIFYNHKGDDYCKQKTSIDEGHFLRNETISKEWNDKYIDLLEPVLDDKNKIRIFDNSCHFLSQDCRHLTEYGAKFYASELETKIGKVLKFRE